MPCSLLDICPAIKSILNKNNELTGISSEIRAHFVTLRRNGAPCAALVRKLAPELASPRSNPLISNEGPYWHGVCLADNARFVESGPDEVGRSDMPKPETGTGPKRRPVKPPAKERPGTPWVSRDVFKRSVGIAAARSASGVPHALFVVHVERLADITDRCGFGAEGALLDLAALILTNLTGDRFPLCRLENDQLAVIKDRCVPSQVSTIARQMRTALEGGVFIWQDLHFRLGVNVGVVVLTPAPGGPGALIRRAREACVAARELGNRGCLLLEGTEREKARIEKDRAWFDQLRETIA
jgi:GGDEF domain-containing protein